MKTKYLDARIKKYEDWDKNGVIKYPEKLELIELKIIKKQLLLHGVVGSKNVLKDYQEAYDYHNQIMTEVEPLSREYFIHYGRREGFRNAIELMTGTEM